MSSGRILPKAYKPRSAKSGPPPLPVTARQAGVVLLSGDDSDEPPTKVQRAARALLLLCICCVFAGAAYDVGGRLMKHGAPASTARAAVPAAPAKPAALTQSVPAAGHEVVVAHHPRRAEWLARKFPEGDGLDTGSRMCYCTVQDQGQDCGRGTNRLVVWGRGYQWGFFSLFYGALCAFNEYGAKTLVDFTSSPDAENLYQVARGDNPWEYAFEQPANVSLIDAELEACGATAGAAGAVCVLRPYEEVNQGDMGCKRDVGAPERCCVLHGDAERATARDKIAFQRLDFLKECRERVGYPNRELTVPQLARAREIAAKNIRLKPEVESAYKRFYNDNLAGKLTIGVHKRETDKNLECATVPSEEFYVIIDSILEGRDAGAEVAIYLATDSTSAVAAFRERYGERVYVREDTHRSTGDQAVHLDTDNRGAGRAKVQEVVVDAMLLGSCDFLLRTGSGVSMAAQVFSKPSQKVHYLHAGHC